MDAGSLLQKETEHTHDRAVHPRILLMAVEVLAAEIPKRLPEYFGSRVCALYPSICTCCAWWDTGLDKNLPVGIWTATSKLPGVWSPPDNQPRPCEKATTALWKEECFCSVSSYHCCVCALCLAYAAFPREASALFLYAYVRLSPCR